MRVYFVLTLSLLLADGVFGDEVTTVSVMEGDSVTLNTGVIKQQRDKMLWYFNDTRIALINGEASKSCLYDGEDGRFRDRLDVEYETGSLTITNIRPEHAGLFEANFIQSKSSGTSESLNRNSKCDSTKITRKMSNIGDTIKTFSVSVRGSLPGPDKPNKEPYKMEKQEECSGLSPTVLAGIVLGVLLLVFVAVAAVVVFFCFRSSNNGERGNVV